MSVRSEIIAQVTQVAEEQDKHLAPLADDLELVNSGLDSLCMAVIVARLEDSLGVDPFTAAESAAFPVTLGEFIEFYENAAK
jgi:acyl carrier protein